MKRFKQYLNEILQTNALAQSQVVTSSATGRAQFRTSPNSQWQDVGSSMPVGAEVRAKLGSTVTINPNTANSTTMQGGRMNIVPGAGSEAEFAKSNTPMSGRADFKIDKVGLSNDFKVLAPRTVLGVAG